MRGCTKRKSARENYLNKIILLSAKHIQVPIHYHCRPRKSRSMEGQRGERHGPARLLPPRPAVQNLPSPKKKSHLRSPMHRLSEGTSRLKAPFGLLAATRQKAGTIRWKDGIQTHFTCPRDFMQQTATTCLCHFRPIPISPPPHTHVNFARCLCRPSHMPMSLWRHAYVTLARCLCHHLRHAYVAKVRCLCRQSDIGISPAPHQKRPVYRCLGCPFFVLFGHFRHEMRILRGLQ